MAHTSKVLPSLLKQEQVAATEALLSLAVPPWQQSPSPHHTTVSNISNACRESHVELPVTPRLQRATHTHTHTEHANGCTPSVLVSRAFLKGLKRIVSSAKGPLQRLEDTIRRDQLHFRTFIAELAAYKDCLQTLRESLLKDNLTPTPESFSGSMLAAACTPLWKRPSLRTHTINKEKRQKAYLTLPLDYELFNSPSPASFSLEVCGSSSCRRRRNRQE